MGPKKKSSKVSVLPVASTTSKQMQQQVVKINPLQIPEILDMILTKLEDGALLVKLRVISKLWKETIDYICPRKRSLWLGKLSSQGFVMSDVIDEDDRFVRFKRLDGNGATRLDRKFADKLIRNFPSVKRLVFDNLKQASIPHLQSLLTFWNENLTTLSLQFGQPSGMITYELVQQINKMKSLTYLSLSARSGMQGNLSSELVSQLKHLSIYNSIDDEKLPPLGNNCTSLALSDFNVPRLQRYFEKNPAQVLANITHLGLNYFSDEKSLLDIICQHFNSLEVLQLSFKRYGFSAGGSQCGKLAKFPNLKKLSLKTLELDLDELKKVGASTPLSSVRVFELKRFQIKGIDFGNSSDFKGAKFCRILASVFPNLEEFGYYIDPITIENDYDYGYRSRYNKYRYDNDEESEEHIHHEIANNVKRFPKLLKFQKFAQYAFILA